MMNRYHGFACNEGECLLRKVGAQKWSLYYGSYEDENGKWCYHKKYDHQPNRDEIVADIAARIDEATRELILTGKRVNVGGHEGPVWLSEENQMNFKMANDMAITTNGNSLPVTLKVGENKGIPFSCTFESIEDITDFWAGCYEHIVLCLNIGWREKEKLQDMNVVYE